MSKINSYGPSLIVLTTAVVVLMAGPAAVRRISFAHAGAEIRRAGLRLDENDLLGRLNQAFRDIATVVEPSVVHISTEHIIEDGLGHQARKASSGSGWVYDAQGHVVTNHHVIEDAVRIEVQLHDGVIRAAEVLGSDPSTDVAVLRIDPGHLHPATLRDPALDPVFQGDMVFAFGSPFDFRFSMSSGVISGKGRSVGVIRDAYGQRNGYENFIQVDAAINPGNSGGPLTDYRGHVIGMNTAIATGPRRRGDLDEGQFAGIGLAIPIEMIVPVVTQIVQNDGVVAKGYLGVSVLDAKHLLADDLEMLGFKGQGLVVGRIEPAHAAAAAGLHFGDLITHVNGTPVGSVDEFLEITAALESGANAVLSVWRFEESRDSPDRLDVQVPGALARSGLRGVTMLPTDATIGRFLEQLGFSGQGVLVVHLVPDGPAQRAGLRRGDVVSRVSGQRVSTVQQLRSTVSSMMPGDTARLSVWRYDPARDRADALDLDAALVRLNTLELFGELPADQRIDQISEIGIQKMVTASREKASALGIQFYPGVIVEEVVKGSYLEHELDAPSTIVEVMDHPVLTVEDFVEALREYKLRVPYGVWVTVMRGDGRSDRTRLHVR